MIEAIETVFAIDRSNADMTVSLTRVAVAALGRCSSYFLHYRSRDEWRLNAAMDESSSGSAVRKTKRMKEI